MGSGTQGHLRRVVEWNCQGVQYRTFLGNPISQSMSVSRRSREEVSWLRVVPGWMYVCAIRCEYSSLSRREMVWSQGFLPVRRGGEELWDELEPILWERH